MQLGNLMEPCQKKTIYFTSGETLEEDDSEQEEEGGDMSPFQLYNTTIQEKMSWRAYSLFIWMKLGQMSLQTCDFLGEKLARLFGLTAAKYQYAVDEHHRSQKMCDRALTETAHIEGQGKLHLSQRVGEEYGATGTREALSQHASNQSREHAGSHNATYQEDEL